MDAPEEIALRSQGNHWFPGQSSTSRRETCQEDMRGQIQSDSYLEPQNSTKVLQGAGFIWSSS